MPIGRSLLYFLSTGNLKSRSGLDLQQTAGTRNAQPHCIPSHLRVISTVSQVISTVSQVISTVSRVISTVSRVISTVSRVIYQSSMAMRPSSYESGASINELIEANCAQPQASPSWPSASTTCASSRTLDRSIAALSSRRPGDVPEMYPRYSRDHFRSVHRGAFFAQARRYSRDIAER